MDERYGIAMSIMTETDMGEEMMRRDDGEKYTATSFDEAVLEARGHAELEDKMVSDWIYRIVFIDRNYRRYGSSIETYCSVPEFHKVKNSNHGEILTL